MKAARIARAPVEEVCAVENCGTVLGAPRDRGGFCSTCADELDASRPRYPSAEDDDARERMEDERRFAPPVRRLVEVTRVGTFVESRCELGHFMMVRRESLFGFCLGCKSERQGAL